MMVPIASKEMAWISLNCSFNSLSPFRDLPSAAAVFCVAVLLGYGFAVFPFCRYRKTAALHYFFAPPTRSFFLCPMLSAFLPFFRHSHFLTPFTYQASRAKGRNGFADPLAKSNQMTVYGFPVFSWQNVPEGKFCLRGILGFDQSPPVGDPVDMRIHTDSIPIITRRHHKVGGFSADTLQFEQLFD
jgi:hypothetical protein